MIVRTAWQNALYYSNRGFIYYNNLSLQELLDHFHNIHRKMFENNAWNLEHMAIVNGREL